MKVKAGKKYRKLISPLKGQVFEVKFVCALPGVLEGPALVNDNGIFFLVDNTVHDIRNADVWEEVDDKTKTTSTKKSLSFNTKEGIILYEENEEVAE